MVCERTGLAMLRRCFTVIISHYDDRDEWNRHMSAALDLAYPCRSAKQQKAALFIK